MADEIDIANARAELELALALQARQRLQDTASLHCIDCGADNAARARIGRSRCIDCQELRERSNEWRGVRF